MLLTKHDVTVTLSLTKGCIGKRQSQNENQIIIAIGTASANSVESDHGCTSRIYFDSVTLMLLNVTMTLQKPLQHNYKCDCSKPIGYK